GIITSKQLREKRRYFIVVAFIIAAVLTPPDVISQASLAIPLLALYEGSIIAVRMVEKKAAAKTAATGAPPAANPAEEGRFAVPKAVYSGYWMRAFTGAIQEWPAMHDIKSIRDDPAAFDAGLKRRGLGAVVSPAPQ